MAGEALYRLDAVPVGHCCPRGEHWSVRPQWGDDTGLHGGDSAGCCPEGQEWYDTRCLPPFTECPGDNPNCRGGSQPGIGDPGVGEPEPLSIRVLRELDAPAHPPPAARDAFLVRIAALEVEPRTARAEVTRSLLTRHSVLRRCAENAWRPDPTLTGSLRVRATVSEAGERTVTTEGTLGGSVFSACVENQARHMPFTGGVALQLAFVIELVARAP